MNLMDDKGSLWIRVRRKKYTGCLKIREFRIQSVVGDYFSSPNMDVKSTPLRVVLLNSSRVLKRLPYKLVS
jgi:hypothetical protein